MMKKNTWIRYFIFIFLVLFLNIKNSSADLCPTIPSLVNEGKGNCVLCGIFRLISEVFSDAVIKSWELFAQPLAVVVALGAAIYVALITLKNLFPTSQQNVMAYLSSDRGGVIPFLFKAAFITVILYDQSSVYELLISPVISAGMEIGTLFGGVSISSSFTNASNVQSMFNSVIEQIQSFNDEVYIIIALGRFFWCLTFLPSFILDWHFSLFPLSLILSAFGWMIFLGMSFYMLDILIRLGVACIMLPMSIACAICKYTSDYTTRNLNLFINVFFHFVILGVILSFVTTLLIHAISDFVSDDFSKKIMGNSPLTEADAKDFVDQIGNSYCLFIVYITACCMLSFKLFMEIEQIVDKISSSSSVGKLGQKLGATTANAVKAPASKILKQGSNFVKAGRDETVSRLKQTKAYVGSQRAAYRLKSSVKKFFHVR